MAPDSRGWPPRLGLTMLALASATLCGAFTTIRPLGSRPSALKGSSLLLSEVVPSGTVRVAYSSSPTEDVEYRKPGEKRPRRVDERILRAIEKNEYSLFEMLAGPDRSDIQLVDMPVELEPIAEGLLRSTRRSRRARITVLKALIRSYDARRHMHAAVEDGKTVNKFMHRIVTVAALLGESEIDYNSITAALLCESPLALEEIEEEFGKSVANIVRGYHRMRIVENHIHEIRGLLHDYPKRLAEEGQNLQNLLISVAQDWRSVALRVAFVRADMEGPFSSKSEESNRMYASLNIWAPLAEKAGMAVLKNDIEGKAFEYLMPEEHQHITAQLRERQDRDMSVLRQAKTEVRQALLQDPVFMTNTKFFSVSGRVKQPFSVWKKLQKNNCALDDLHDVVALRIVCEPVCEPGMSQEEVSRRGEELCRYALSVVHKLRPWHPSRLKDYIQNPKPNGYQSLHTTLQMRLAGTACPFEVQIRTHEMHHRAEFGLAAHQIYKGDSSLGRLMKASLSNKKYPTQVKRHGDFLAWLQSMLVESQVLVFGPDGRVVNLRPGTTLSDLVRSYEWRRNLSKKVIKSLRVNGKRAFLGTTLATGDVVSF